MTRDPSGPPAAGNDVATDGHEAQRPVDPPSPKDLFGSKDRAARKTPRPQLRAAKDQAALEMSRGSFSRAVAVFVELCAEEPSEGQWPLRAADAMRKLGRIDEAVRFYHRAATVFREHGHLERATAVARIIKDLSGDDSLLRKLDPGALCQSSRLVLSGDNR